MAEQGGLKIEVRTPQQRCLNYWLTRYTRPSGQPAAVTPLRCVAPLRRLTFGSRPKSKQKVLPLAYGPTASGSLAPSLLQGPAAKGHPWPIAAFAASMSLNPLRNDSTRPPERGACLGANRWVRRHSQSTRKASREDQPIAQIKPQRRSSIITRSRAATTDSAAPARPPPRASPAATRATAAAHGAGA